MDGEVHRPLIVCDKGRCKTDSVCSHVFDYMFKFHVLSVEARCFVYLVGQLLLVGPVRVSGPSVVGNSILLICHEWLLLSHVFVYMLKFHVLSIGERWLVYLAGHLSLVGSVQVSGQLVVGNSVLLIRLEWLLQSQES